MVALLTENVVEIILKHLLLLLLSVVKYHTEFFHTQVCFQSVCSKESPVHCSCERLVVTGRGTDLFSQWKCSLRESSRPLRRLWQALLWPGDSSRKCPSLCRCSSPNRGCSVGGGAGLAQQVTAVGFQITFLIPVHFTVAQQAVSRKAGQSIHSLEHSNRQKLSVWLFFVWLVFVPPFYFPPSCPTSIPFLPDAVCQ